MKRIIEHDTIHFRFCTSVYRILAPDQVRFYPNLKSFHQKQARNVPQKILSSDIQTEIRTYTKPSITALLHTSTDRALLLPFATSTVSSSYSKTCTQVTNPRTHSRQQLQHRIGTKYTVQRRTYQNTVFECIAYEYNLFFFSHA